ncbi:lytic transglycosylase domain-containing protein [Ferrimonas balearica]|uniref:lytic murein transglycosylase n=1 Tax=Ferrimonas balearica TaxID=44012 RepID=UPI001C990797|nr:lytic murein transglycosylase [Ferrimonas balearica]MBY5920587.1 lytic murein transglycosylase [Ferrimonas balearica]MBY5996728.1 lytic murein transglycosylase [Ferrimonas balearica]
MWKRAIVAALIGFSASTMAVDADGFRDYVSQLKQEAADKGYQQATIDEAFSDLKLFKRAISADRNQPEFKKTLDTYLPQAVPQWKVDQARKLYKEHKELLEEIGKAYGVQPRFIVALWGIETNFGGYTGNYPVLSTTASLAYEGRREAFFKEQFFAAMTILDEGHISADAMRGSWAGAMGQTQFMPTSFLSYAQDYDGDGRKDIWGSLPDVFASAANYLKNVGWEYDQTWARQVKLTAPVAEENQGLKVKKTLEEWQALGVRRFDGTDLPARGIEASLVFPDDAHGRVYLAYANYDALMRWNRSHYFAVAVGYLSDRIKFPPIE